VIKTRPDSVEDGPASIAHSGSSSAPHGRFHILLEASESVLHGWTVAAIATIQPGSALTIADTNSANVFGISENRTQLTGTCTKSQLVRSGSNQSKLNRYFNASCFASPPVIGSDGIGTSLGNSATGMVDGPGQVNIDLALSKAMSFDWPHEKSSLTFRSELYNALNHPQFANPDSNFTSRTFGVISLPLSILVLCNWP
jgi:hypothetical protein